MVLDKKSRSSKPGVLAGLITQRPLVQMSTLSFRKRKGTVSKENYNTKMIGSIQTKTHD